MSLGSLASMARLDRLTLAIGEASFGAVLAETLRAVGDVEHVMIFAYPPRQPPRAVVSAGSIDAETARASQARYAEQFYLLDPNYQAIRRQRAGAASWFEFEGGRGWSAPIRAGLLDPCAISDLYAFAVVQDDVVYYVMFLRVEERSFSSAQRWLINEVGEMVAAHVRKHFSYMHAVRGQNQFLISRVLTEAPGFNRISPRERAVCVGILTGHTSESIAINLSISINSVLTFRKRLYEKLAISSQNELFVRVIDAMIALGRDQGGGVMPSVAGPLRGLDALPAAAVDQDWAEALLA